jgi:hypothetical protein
MNKEKLLFGIVNVISGFSRYFYMLFRVMIAVTVIFVLAYHGVFEQSALVKWVVVISSYCYVFRIVIDWIYGLDKKQREIK